MPDRFVAVGTWGNINLYDGERFESLPLSPSTCYHVPDSKMLFQMECDNHKLLWMKCVNELWCLDLFRGRYVENFDSLFKNICPSIKAGEKVCNVFVDSDMNDWLVMNGKIYDPVMKKMVPLPKTMEDVCFLERGDTCIVVMDTKGECVCYDSRTHDIRFHCRNKDIPSLDYWEVLTTYGEDGNIYQMYVGNKSHLYRFTPKTCSFDCIYTSDYMIRYMTLSPDNCFWLTSRHGIQILDINGKLKKRINSLPVRNKGIIECTDVSTVAFEGRSDGIVWLGLTDTGILYSHNCSHAMTSADNPESLGLPDTLASFFHRRRSLQYKDALSYPYNDELKDCRGWVWRASSHGLLLVIPGKEERMLGKSDGLSNAYIHSLAEDKEGVIWMATSGGISSVVVGNDDSCLKVTNYDESEGCLEGEYYPCNATCLDDGRIVMQGFAGWTAFMPNDVKKKSQALSPKLVRITVNNVVLHAGDNNGMVMLDSEPPYIDKMELDYDQNQIFFEFSAFNFAHPIQTFYRWRLVSDNDTAWNYASYQSTPMLVNEKGMLNLPAIHLVPDNYRLEVEASYAGRAFGNRCVFEFRILPPWWRTWWAYTLYVLLCVLAVCAVVWKYMRDKQRELEWKRQEDILQLRIQHLLEHAELQPIMHSDDGAECNDEYDSQEQYRISEQDNEFIQNVVAKIEEHINETYTVEQLAVDMCMERTGLYKRLTALIDQSPQTFIRSIRLQRAADLVGQTSQSISDIAYAVGFTSPSYFVKCFKEKYGCTPGEYRSRKNVANVHGGSEDK
ncbi:MAG: helix-turn-helix domain-containing protein [Bacteroides sp.]|nr:helix-turn-helix domain-containing protein [Bacteroides sp.]MCM1420321.1 helix-turn-helix domain-containing protein [Bacteroides sp.]